MSDEGERRERSGPRRSAHRSHGRTGGRGRARWQTVLAPGWHPDDATESNGAVWPTLGTALWALRATSTFEAALRSVVDLGNRVHTPLPGFGPKTWHAADLVCLALALPARLTG